MKLSKTQLDVLQHMQDGFMLRHIPGRGPYGVNELSRLAKMDIYVRWATLCCLLDKHAINIESESDVETLFDMTEEGKAALSEARPF